MNDTVRKKIHFALLLLVLSFAWNSICYWGSRLLTDGRAHFSIGLLPDSMIPLVPVTVVIYFVSYLFWFVNYFIAGFGRLSDPVAGDCASRGSAEQDDPVGRFFAADFISRVICLVLFLAVPTAIARPEPGNESVFDILLLLLYRLDEPNTLFPSIHCLASWLCWAGVRRRSDIPAWYRHFSLIFALLICVSTLTTKQHFILDVVGGVILAELCFRLAGIKRVRDFYMKPVRRLAKRAGII